jgi:hypothetical protein
VKVPFIATIRKPIIWLLAITLAAGLLTFRDYGLTWDEPLFYKYADALGYAYTPANWLGGHFDLNQSYGPSGDDHKTRGPGYLLLAREPAHFLQWLNVNPIAAWHFVNFATFLVGVYFVYRLCAMFASQQAAVIAAALFGFQPMLWGHGFINPKDMPFLVFLTGSIWLGFRMVDGLVDQPDRPPAGRVTQILLPAAFLGIASSNRVLGPLAGVLVVAYFLTRSPSWRIARWIVVYAVVATLIMLATWPYLWESPFRFLDVFRFMSDNPTVLSVLFADHVYHAYDLPRRYLPFFLLTTLTEVVWPLFTAGILVIGLRLRRNAPRPAALALVLAWFIVPVSYAVLQRPPMYDGMRHFLFVLPPVFVFGAVGLDFILDKSKRDWIRLALAAAVVAPGLLGIVTLHPYEYAYFNSFVGGTGGAFRHYETDYWLACYKEAVEGFNQSVEGPARLFVHREAAVAGPYAKPNVTVLDERGALLTIRSGDFVLVNTRTNEDRQSFHDAPVLLTVSRAGAVFCVIKRVP